MYIDMTGIQWPKTSTITSTGTIPIDPYTAGGYNNTTAPSVFDLVDILTDRIAKLEKQLDISNIAILAAMQKFTKEECENLKKMLDSNDSASVELAKTIIEQSLCQ